MMSLGFSVEEDSDEAALVADTERLLAEYIREQESLIQVHHIALTQKVIRDLQIDPKLIYSLSPDTFEVLVCDRLSKMDFEVRRTGNVNQKDGGIDIVFWKDGPVPILGAAQAKHHRTREATTRAPEIRDFQGALGDEFQVGIVVTNTGFSADAKWFAEHRSTILRLRDGDELQRWIRDDFTRGLQQFDAQRTIELCPGVSIDVPWFK
ncbi:Restriction endonuclease [Caulifigura coniformis]|uniref:Restriction endonuclease n=1 Tax=Caulifigura coniformis TaxID=2527983 RepID=A0A517SC09_9PLAN|nr:restriction endonuclease [Caulifigura coniformis]QDT53662.1 Restriction endonuclease [Caulifigura coniformis]